MKRVAFLAILFLSSLGPAREIVLSECNIYPDFNPDAIRYLSHGPSFYGSWFYDLVYRNVQQVLIDCSGTPITRSAIRQEHFEIEEDMGTKESLGQDVKAYLLSHQVDRCP